MYNSPMRCTGDHSYFGHQAFKLLTPLGASWEGLRVKGQLCCIASSLGFLPCLEHRALHCRVPAGNFLGKASCGFPNAFPNQRSLGYENTILRM